MSLFEFHFAQQGQLCLFGQNLAAVDAAASVLFLCSPFVLCLFAVSALSALTLSPLSLSGNFVKFDSVSV